MIEGYTKIGLSIERTMAETAKDLFKRHIRTFCPTDGWIARQSAVSRWGSADPDWADDPSNGAVLDAELVKDTATLTIRHDRGVWSITTIIEHKHDGEGDGCLYDRQFQVSVHHGLLEYRRYWRLGADPISPVAYRLAGFRQTPGT